LNDAKTAPSMPIKHFRDDPDSGHIADIAPSTQMAWNGHRA